MSSFLDATPTLRVGVENVPLGKRYPEAGEALAPSRIPGLVSS
jgi:hypothetical protein